MDPSAVGGRPIGKGDAESDPGEYRYNGLSLNARLFVKCEKICDVKAGSFIPQPQVKSTVVRLTPRRWKISFPEWSALVSLIFARRKKSLQAVFKGREVANTLEANHREFCRLRREPRPKRFVKTPVATVCLRLMGPELGARCAAELDAPVLQNLLLKFHANNIFLHPNTVMKSVTLDKWQPKWLEVVGKLGNKTVNSYYEFRLADGRERRKPTSQASIETKRAYVIAKYERKEWCPKDSRSNPAPNELLAQGRDPEAYLNSAVNSAQAATAGKNQHGRDFFVDPEQGRMGLAGVGNGSTGPGSANASARAAGGGVFTTGNSSSSTFAPNLLDDDFGNFGSSGASSQGGTSSQADKLASFNSNLANLYSSGTAHQNRGNMDAFGGLGAAFGGAGPSTNMMNGGLGFPVQQPAAMNGGLGTLGSGGLGNGYSNPLPPRKSGGLEDLVSGTVTSQPLQSPKMFPHPSPPNASAGFPHTSEAAGLMADHQHTPTSRPKMLNFGSTNRFQPPTILKQEQSIGFVGLGAMGAPMLKKLYYSHIFKHVYIWNRTRERMQKTVQSIFAGDDEDEASGVGVGSKGWGNVGSSTMNSSMGRVAPLGESNARLRNYLRSAAHVETEIAPQESLERLATACKGETIVLMLATDKATEECVETLLTAGFEGTLVNCATLSPDCVQRLSSKCNDASVLTAKPMKLITGCPELARQGRLCCWVSGGGSAIGNDAFNVQFVVDKVATFWTRTPEDVQVLSVEDVTASAKFKLATAFAVYGMNAAMGEAIVMLERSGVKREQMQKFAKAMFPKSLLELHAMKMIERKLKVEECHAGSPLMVAKRDVDLMQEMLSPLPALASLEENAALDPETPQTTNAASLKRTSSPKFLAGKDSQDDLSPPSEESAQEVVDEDKRPGQNESRVFLPTLELLSSYLEAQVAKAGQAADNSIEEGKCETGCQKKDNWHSLLEQIEEAADSCRGAVCPNGEGEMEGGEESAKRQRTA
eukprot:g9293.t1